MYKISTFVLADGRILSVKSDKICINSVHMVSGQFTITTRDVMMTARICSFKIKLKIKQAAVLVLIFGVEVSDI